MAHEPIIRLGGTAVLRNPNLLPLDDVQLKRFAPTIFARHGIEGVSDNYGHVSTIEILRAMREAGYEIVEVRQSKRRDSDRMPYTKHLIKLKPQGTIKSFLKLGDVVPQIVMLNSHDRSSGFSLYYGMYRYVCLNGLIVSDGPLVQPLRIRHTVNVVADVLEKSRTLIKGGDGVYALREAMLNVSLSKRQATTFAVAALQYRPPRRLGVMLPETLLRVRRPEDDHDDLWHVFNRVQENMVAGGNELATDQGRTVANRGIGRIERDVAVNSALWQLAVATMTKATGKTAKHVREHATINI